MRSADIEAWTLREVDRVLRGSGHEDARVEFKSEFIPPEKAARLVAAHANAALGEPILWIIGVDHKKGIVVGVPREELSDWMNKLQSNFDQYSPDVRDVLVPVGDQAVMALLWDTSRAPFVVKTMMGGPVAFEVPWRDGTRTRSARRSDLIRLLQPSSKTPEIELFEGSARFNVEHTGPGQHDYSHRWMFDLNFYVVPRGREQVVIPRHRCLLTFEMLGAIPKTQAQKIRLAPPEPEKHGLDLFRVAFQEDIALEHSLTVRASRFEAFIDGPGRLALTAYGFTPIIDPVPDQLVEFQIAMWPTSTDRPAVLGGRMRRRQLYPGAQPEWVLVEPAYFP